MKFLAIDFETADYGRDSACALGLVRVEEGKITKRKHLLIRPPRRDMVFTYIHGITWEDVVDQPTFGEQWAEIAAMMEGVEFLVAHNASFDRSVLHECCRVAGIPIPTLDFQCTMQLSRKIWKLYPTNLPAVCRHFGIPLKHHDAASDTEACARIMIEALKAFEVES
jgi:DNA polymerase-3 subunit epsilon